MKKIIVVLVLIAASSRLMAQSSQALPYVKLNNSLQNAFKPNSNLSAQAFLTQSKPDMETNSVTSYSCMPVAKVSSTDKMPVAPLGKNGVNYTMLIIKEKVINPAEQPLTEPIP